MATAGEKPNPAPNSCIVTSPPGPNYSPDIPGDPLAVEMAQSLHTEKWDSAAPGIASSMTECHTTELCYAAAASADDPAMATLSGSY